MSTSALGIVVVLVLILIAVVINVYKFYLTRKKNEMECKRKIENVAVEMKCKTNLTNGKDCCGKQLGCIDDLKRVSDIDLLDNTTSLSKDSNGKNTNSLYDTVNTYIKPNVQYELFSSNSSPFKKHIDSNKLVTAVKWKSIDSQPTIDGLTRVEDLTDLINE